MPRGFDYRLIERLINSYGLKQVQIAEWFGITRQAVSDVLLRQPGSRADTWTGKSITVNEDQQLLDLVANKRFSSCKNGVLCCCFNNGKDDFFCIFVNETEVKGFFLSDLPEETRKAVVNGNYHRFTEKEISGESKGTIVSIIKKEYFIPDDPVKFRNNAGLRGMSDEEYAVFISGYPLGDRRCKTDDDIIRFYDENLKDGKVYISSDPKNQWIRSLASRNGFGIKEFIELYGYESWYDGTELTSAGARERHIDELKKCVVQGNEVYLSIGSATYGKLNTYSSRVGLKLDDYIKSLGFKRTMVRPDPAGMPDESDMEVRPVKEDAGYLAKVFAEYPLLGSKVISEKNLNSINEKARETIRSGLNARDRLTKAAKEILTFAVINCAKGWDSNDSGEFWKYIVLKFGYRDNDGRVYRLLTEAIKDCLKSEKRLFIEGNSGNEFRNSVLVHAMSPKRTWMALFDFLYDFYRTNLNGTIVSDDPLVETMVRCLRQKFGADDSEDKDLDLNISSQHYLFQAGIRKLVIKRPAYSRKLFEKLLFRIDSLIKNNSLQPKTYEEQLCDEWFRNKISSILESYRNEPSVKRREVATNYSHISVRYKWKKDHVEVCIPDIRLEEFVSSAKVVMRVNETTVCERELRRYGNELGISVMGEDLSLPRDPESTDMYRLQVTIVCDDEEVYDTGRSLYRDIWIFDGEREISKDNLKCGSFLILVPKEAAIATVNARIEEIPIDESQGLKIFSLELEKGYAITINEKLISTYDDAHDFLKVLLPAGAADRPKFYCCEQEHLIVLQDEYCNIVLDDAMLSGRYVILKNGTQLKLPAGAAANPLFSVGLGTVGEKTMVQILDMEHESVIFNRSFYVVEKAEFRFNRKFYYSHDDFDGAAIDVNINDLEDVIFFSEVDEQVKIPYEDGIICIDVPSVKVEESTGQWFSGKGEAYFIEAIPQGSFLQVIELSGVKVRIYVEGNEVPADSNGLIPIGNALYYIKPAAGEKSLKITMTVESNTVEREYHLADVYYTESFLHQPGFWTKGNRLYWDRGGGFIGRSGRVFKLQLKEMSGRAQFSIEMNDGISSVELPEGYIPGKYAFSISIDIADFFTTGSIEIAKGECFVGDPDVIRFQGKQIVIESMTQEDHEYAGSISLADGSFLEEHFIDRITYVGMENLPEGRFRIYTGTMYQKDGYGRRFDLSDRECVTRKGVEKVVINPVRIVYIDASKMFITDPSGGKLPIYRNYNNRYCSNRYAITDRKCINGKESFYSKADIFTYRTERI